MARTLNQRIQWLLEDIQRYDPERVILFGSAARGDTDALSDLDVVLIKRTTAPFVQRGVEAVRYLRSGIGPVDLFVYTPEEFQRMVDDESPFMERVLADGRVLYEKAA